MILTLQLEGQLVLLILKLFTILLETLNVSFGVPYISGQLLVAIRFHMNQLSKLFNVIFDLTVTIPCDLGSFLCLNDFFFEL